MVSYKPRREEMNSINLDLRHVGFRALRKYLSVLDTARYLCFVMAVLAVEGGEKVFCLHAVQAKNDANSIPSPKDGSLFLLMYKDENQKKQELGCVT